MPNPCHSRKQIGKDRVTSGSLKQESSSSVKYIFFNLSINHPVLLSTY